MTRERQRFIRQFLAGLTILSFTLTQAVPAWAMRPEGGGSPKVQAGLEELLGTTASATTATSVAPSLSQISLRGIGSGAVAGVYRALAQLPPGERNTRDMLLAAVDLLKVGVPPEKASVIPGREELERQLDELAAWVPSYRCPTCGAKVAHALLSDPFVNPQRALPEELQSPDFQETELLNAVLLAIGVVQQGRILTQRGADGHLLVSNTLADLRDLLTLTTARPDVDPASRHDWTGVRLTQAQMEQALREGQLVVAHVGGNHFVQVLAVSDRRVTYTDPQISASTGQPTPGVASLPRNKFFEWWKGNARTGTTGVVLIGARPGQAVAGEPLSEAGLASVTGCCGINAVFGHFRGVRKILDAVLRLKYRAPDDTGLLVIKGDGLTVRKVEGAPDELILNERAGIIQNPLFPEELELPENPARNREAIVQHKRTRRTRLIQEGLAGSRWVTPEYDPDPGRQFNDLYDQTLEALYSGVYNIQLGDVGGLFAGWVYTLGGSVDEYQALNGPLLDVQDMISRWDITPTFLKLFIRHRLMQELPAPGDATRDQVLARFDQLADRALKKALDPREKADWERIWNQYLRGRGMRIPPDFNKDPVRHVFRLLDQLVGSLGYMPEQAARIRANFEARRPASVAAAGWEWMTYWREEYRYNMPVHAWASLVDWLQDWALEQKLVPRSVHDRWIERRNQEKAEFGFSRGTVDRSLLLILPEIVVGHGRWAMTGDPKWWNGHPHVTRTRAIVHNGAVEADKNAELGRQDPVNSSRNGEHIRRYEALMQQAAAIRAAGFGDPEADVRAAKIEQDALLNYGNLEVVEGTNQVVKADTRRIVTHWHMMHDDYLADLAAGRVHTDGDSKGQVKTDQPWQLHRPGQTTPDGFPVFDRAGAWNQVVKNLRELQGIDSPNPDEVAHRVAMMELAPGSSLATDGVSLATPLTEFVTSHDRPVDIVIYQKRDGNGHLLYEDYMVTSDQAAGIGLFPASEVFAAATVLGNLEEQVVREVDRLLDQRRYNRIPEDQFAREVRGVINHWQAEVKRITEGEEVKRATPDGEPSWFQGGFRVKVYHLKGEEKHAVLTRRLNEQGVPVVDVRISHFNGEPLNQLVEAEEKMGKPVWETVNPSLGDKGRFASFMEKHIAEIPLILLRQIMSYTRTEPGTDRLSVDLATRFTEGEDLVLVQREDGLGTRLPDGAKKRITQHGVNDAVILRHFGAGLEEGVAPKKPVSRIPGLRRIFLNGVGSSWRDARVAQAIFQDLLPGVELLVYDPVDISNRGIPLDPRHDLMVGLSWSGTTDSTVRLFNRLESDGFVTISVTGKPNSDMGRISALSGGTINVLSGDESTVATTKGFESILFSLSLLAVHLSQLAGDPSLEERRAGYIADLRRVADLAYVILNEGKKPAADRVLELDAQPDEPPSQVMRLGQRYRERHKLLWVGSRNMPIHTEGELKGEEIVSSKDPNKASMVGIAADIEDSSWQATVSHNYDPLAREEDKVVLGFDMTDPDRFDAFMEEIRELAAAGADFYVMTYDSQANPYAEELEAIAAQSGGRIEIITVPSVHPNLQGLVNAIYYFRFSAALAKTRGLTPEEMDNSRNLAKSVTVSYAARLAELLRATKSKVVTIVQQATRWVAEAVQAIGRQVRAMSGTVWGGMKDARMRAIQRLPFVLERAYNSFFAEGSWLTSGEQIRRLEERFGRQGQGIRQIAIVTDEEAAEYAAEASIDPLGAREVVYPATKDGKVDKKIYDEGVRVPIKGVYYILTFDRSSNTYRLRFDPDFQHNKGLPPPANPDFKVNQGVKEVTVNGFWYEVLPTSFMWEKKEPEKLAFGLTLRAVEPELLGVESVKVFRVSDRALLREMDRQDTLFVLVSRSNNFHQQNHRIPPIEGGPKDERGPAELAMPGLRRRPEAAMTELARTLTEKGGRFVTVSDPGSAVSPLGAAALGNVQLPQDLDDTSLYSVTYMGLLSIGVKLGQLREVRQADTYRQALSTVPGLVAEVLRSPSLRTKLRDFVRTFGNYKKIHIAGGGQALADAKEYARALRSLGIFAEAQPNDSLWHGPLAATDPSREKYADPDARTGINPNFNPRNDTLTVILMTDRRFFDTALGGDAQVIDSRNGRYAVVTKKSDAALNSVTSVGAAEIFGLADFPDELGNFANAVAAQYLAAEFGRSHALALGRPILPPVGGVRPLPVPDDFAPRIRREIQATLGETGLRNLFGLAESSRAAGAAQVRIEPSRVRPSSESMILVAVPDRRGLIRAIGGALSGAGVSADSISSDNFPTEVPPGETRIALFALSVSQPADSLRTTGVERVILEGLSVAPPAEPLGPMEEARERLADSVDRQFVADGEIHFESEYVSSVNRTVLVIGGPRGYPGIADAVTGALASAGISISDDYGALPDHGDVSYFVVDRQVPDEAISAIRENADAIVSPPFATETRRQIVKVTPEEMRDLYVDYRAARDRRVSIVSVASEIYSGGERSDVSFAIRDFPADDASRQTLDQAVKKLAREEEVGLIGETEVVRWKSVTLFRYTASQPAQEGSVRELTERIEQEVLSGYRPATGMEELVEGTDFEAVGVNGIRMLRPVTVSGPVRATGKFGTIALDPTKNGTVPGGAITLAPGAWLLDGTRVEGSVVVAPGARVGNYLGGLLERPLLVGSMATVHGEGVNVAESVVGPGVVINGAKVRDATVVPFRQGDRVIPARVGLGSKLGLADEPGKVEPGVTVFGGAVGTDVKFRRNSLIGPSVAVNQGSEHKAILFWGASKEAGVEFPHEGYMGSFGATPIVVSAEPFTPEYYDEFRKILRFVILGTPVSDEAPEKEEKGVISGTGLLRDITMALDDTQRTFQAQRINFGKGTSTSDYNPLTGAKSGGWAMAGVATGVMSVPKAPDILQESVLVANLSQADGVVEPGTLVISLGDALAEMVAKGTLEFPGYRAPGKGFVLGSGLPEEVQAQMDYFQRLRVMAEVLAEGATRATDPYQMAGFAAAVRAVEGQFDELGSRYGKVVQDALKISLENLDKQLESARARRKDLPDDDPRAPELEKRIDKLELRIREQEEVRTNRDQTLRELKEIDGAIKAAAQSVSAVTPVVIAEVVRHQIMHPDVPLVPQEGQRLMDLWDNYAAIQQILRANFGLSPTEVVKLIQEQAAVNGNNFAQEVTGVIDVPDSQLPTEADFDQVLQGTEVLLYSGGNSMRALRQGVQTAGRVATSAAPMWDDGGNYGEWRKFLTKLFGRFVASLGGDVANARTAEATPVTQLIMAERLPVKPKSGWAAGETIRSLLLNEAATALQAFKLQYPGEDPLQDPRLIQTLGTLVSTHRILGRAIGESALMGPKVLSKASGQNMVGLAIAVRSGFLDPSAKQVNPGQLKRALLLWNRALGLDSTGGLVFPDTLEGARDYFVYSRVLPVQAVLNEEALKEGKTVVETIKLGVEPKPGEIAPEDYFEVTLENGTLVLTDGAGRRLEYDPAQRAYYRAPQGDDKTGNRFEEFPTQVDLAIREQVARVVTISIIRGEDNASEADTIYDTTSDGQPIEVIVWGAEYRVGEEPHAAPVLQEIQQAVLDEKSSVRTIVFGVGSEGTSIAPHFWLPENVRFLRELADRRRAGRPVPRVVFVVNPSETNDSYNLGPLGIIRNYELLMRQVLGDESVRFEDLFPEIVLFDHTDPWVLPRNRAVADAYSKWLQEVKGKPVAEADAKAWAEVGYRDILAPLPGGKHGHIKKNRRAMPLDDAIRDELEIRFGKGNVHVGPYADVALTVESSRGQITYSPRVQVVDHRLNAVLYPERRTALLPTAVQVERRLYGEKNDGVDPTPDQLAEFLNRVGYSTTAAEVQTIMTAGLEELEAGRLPVLTQFISVTDSAAERPRTPITVPAAAAIPADVRSVLGELAKARVQSNLYGMIFAEPVGLAIGVALPAQDEGGQPLPRRFVVANESQEQTLKDLGVDPAEMVRAWDPAYGGSIDLAIEAARSGLESRGAIVLDQTVIRGLTPTFAGEFLSRIQSLSALLTPRDYSPESAAKTAEKVYDLFV